jgi:hypothetical protein
MQPAPVRMMPVQPTPAQPMPVRMMPVQPMPGQPMPVRMMPVQPMPGAPGGPGSYRPPSYGFALPSYWVAPTYFIADYRAYGLGRPAWGFGWSRYYDDYVLTDRWGRVYDWRRGDGYRGDDRGRDDYDRAPARKRDRSSIVGAIIGGAIGAVTGNLIAGAGSRLAGSLIGGGVGALAGQAIDRESQKGRGRGRDYGRDYGREYGYDDGYRPDPRPHWDMGYWSGQSGATYGGCNCTETVTTITEPGRPIVTKKVRYVTEYVTVPARTKYVRTKYVPRGKYVQLD